MKQVAIIQTGYPSYDYENSGTIITSITDWSEVSDEDYEILKKASRRQGFVLITRPTDEDRFIKDSIQKYLEDEKKRIDETEKQKIKYEKKKQETKEIRERKAFEKLKAKFEGK